MPHINFSIHKIVVFEQGDFESRIFLKIAGPTKEASYLKDSHIWNHNIMDLSILRNDYLSSIRMRKDAAPSVAE